MEGLQCSFFLPVTWRALVFGLCGGPDDNWVLRFVLFVFVIDGSSDELVFVLYGVGADDISYPFPVLGHRHFLLRSEGGFLILGRCRFQFEVPSPGMTIVSIT